MTKGERALAALLAAHEMLNQEPLNLQVAIEAGRMSAITHFAGFLTTAQINTEIAKTTEILADTTFAERFEKRLEEG
jgi:hypothetical protein